MKVCVISFSGRKNGNCGAIGKMLHESYRDSVFYDFSEFAIAPCGGCRLECFKDREACPYRKDKVYTIYDSILHSDITYFIVPNYCDYPNALFFAFNERSQCYFQGHEELLEEYLQKEKKFIVISNTNRENFERAFLYHSETPDILFLSAKRYKKISIDGDLTESPEAVADILKFRKPEE